jgi:hypothetical protein
MRLPINIADILATTLITPYTPGGAATSAGSVSANTAHFDGVLSGLDDNLQKALETIDEYMMTGSVGEDVVTGNVVYEHTDGALYKALASDATKMPAVGVVDRDASLGGKVRVVRGMSAYVTRDMDFTGGDVIFVSRTNAGNATNTPPSTSGDIVQKIGVAKTLNRIYVSVDLSTMIVG